MSNEVKKDKIKKLKQINTSDGETNSDTQKTKQLDIPEGEVHPDTQKSTKPADLIRSALETLHTMPEGLKRTYNELYKSEEIITNLVNQANLIKEKLKPLSRKDKRRGLKKEPLTKSERKILKTTHKRLEKLIFQEKDNFSALIKEFGLNVKQDRTKVISELELIKAKSSNYINRNKALVDRKIKKIFNFAINTPDELSNFKKFLSDPNNESVETTVKQFLEKFDKNKFILAAYQTHDSLRTDFIDSLKNILNEWEPMDNNFEFLDAKAKFNIKVKGVKR